MAKKNLRGQLAPTRQREAGTHTLAIRLNCSSRFLGKKVMMVYLDVMTWLVE